MRGNRGGVGHLSGWVGVGVGADNEHFSAVAGKFHLVCCQPKPQSRFACPGGKWRFTFTILLRSVANSPFPENWCNYTPTESAALILVNQRDHPIR